MDQVVECVFVNPIRFRIAFIKLKEGVKYLTKLIKL